MPAKSRKQQMAAGAALAAKRGERSRATLKGASRQMARSMSEKQLEDFPQIKRKKLPTKKSSQHPVPSSRSCATVSIRGARPSRAWISASRRNELSPEGGRIRRARLGRTLVPLTTDRIDQIAPAAAGRIGVRAAGNKTTTSKKKEEALRINSNLKPQIL
jgi:hypothetical protein